MSSGLKFCRLKTSEVKEVEFVPLWEVPVFNDGEDERAFQNYSDRNRRLYDVYETLEDLFWHPYNGDASDCDDNGFDVDESIAAWHHDDGLTVADDVIEDQHRSELMYDGLDEEQV